MSETQECAAVPNRAKPLKNKGKPATRATERVEVSRSRGALLGLCVGEALGVTHDGRHLAAPLFPQACDGPQVELLGRGAFDVRRGQVLSAAQAATALASSLKAYRGFDVEAVGKAYAKWLPEALEVDDTTRLALEQVLEGRSGEYTGKRVWLEQQQQGKQSPPLARAAPLAVFFRDDRPGRLKATLADCAITHFAPLCQLACATLNALIAQSITTPKDGLDAADLRKILEADLSLAAATLGREQPDWVQAVKDAADALRVDIQEAQADDPQLYGPELHLFHQPRSVRVAFRLMLWELFHADTFEAGLLDVINRGGNTAAHGAIVGALLGARFGEEGIPEAWREGVLECVPSGSPKLNTTYHPRFLVTLAGLSPQTPRGEDEELPLEKG